jgi:N-acetylneuraminic acid mutarotase
MLAKNISHYFLAALVLTGCKIQVVVPPGGNVATQSESYFCGSGEVCMIDVVDLFFSELFVAQPDDGYTFVQWKKRNRGICAGLDRACLVNSSIAGANEVFMAILESDTTYYLEPDFGLSDTWASRAELPGEASAMASCSIRGKLYAAGIGSGSTSQGNPGTPETEVRVYDPATNNWTRVADMPTGRRWGSASAVNNRCYVIGGLGATAGASSSVEEYNPVTDTWRKVAPLPTPRSAHASATVDGKIYVIGGGARPGWRQVGTAEVGIYDPDRDVWSAGADMPVPRGGAVAGAIDGYIYVVGGSNPEIPNSDLVHRYHPAADSWQQMASLPVEVDFATAAVLNGSLYVIGGLEETDNLLPSPADNATAAVYRYNPKANQWQRLADMSQRRMAAGSEAVSGRILVIGGREQRDCCGSLDSVEEYTP